MTRLKTALVAAATIVLATASLAAPLKLKPADPQPSGLKNGLAVSYAYPSDVKTLGNAQNALRRSKPGPALAGLDYRDTDDGDNTLTSKRAHHVVAKITGYVKFEAAGTYNIDFLTNDGLDASIGGVGGGIGETATVDPEEFDYNLAATFTKPGVFTPDTDLTANIFAKRDFNETFTETSTGGSLKLTNYVTDNLTVSGGVFGEYGEFEDAYGTRQIGPRACQP